MKWTNLAAVAAMLPTTMVGIAVVPLTASAQTRAALVQNIDEPGRNPYQATANAICFASCTLTFSPVPAGMRLVVTHVNGTIDTIGTGVVPRIVFGSMTLPAVRGIAVGSTFQLIFDLNTLAYYGPGEQPVIFSDFNLELFRSPTDRFAGPSGATLTGYYVKLP